MFEQGDKVICVNARPGSSLKNGETYVVTTCFSSLSHEGQNQFVELEGHEDTDYLATRFVLATELNQELT